MNVNKQKGRSTVIILVFIGAVLVSSGPLHADIAPMVFAGTSLTLTANGAVQMKNEEIDIFYEGRICRVEARFVMENVKENTISLRIGFPISQHMRMLVSKITSDRLYDFVVRAQGRPVESVTRQGVGTMPEPPMQQVDWYSWVQDFPPGSTVVEVSYRVYHSHVYKSYGFKTIDYIFWTGALWRNRIESARLSIHFPKKVDPEQISTYTKPAGFIIDDRVVTWRFRDFEPRREDDVKLAFVPFRLFEEIQALREQIEKDSRAVEPRLALARLYCTVICPESIGSYLPRDLTPGNFARLTGRITALEDRLYWQSAYALDPKKGLYSPEFEYDRGENGDKLTRLKEILIRIGYEPQDLESGPLDRYRAEAERLLQEAVRIDPSHVAAWNTYLFYYGQMHFAAFLPVRRGIFDYGSIPRGQKELILRAHAACPGDSIIQLWRALIDDSLKIIPREIGELDNTGRKPEWRSPKNPDGSRITLSHDEREIAAVFVYYNKRIKSFISYRKLSGNSITTYTWDLRGKDIRTWLRKMILPILYRNRSFCFDLVLKNGPLDDAKRTEILRILNRVFFFHWSHSIKIWHHAAQTGIAGDDRDIFDKYSENI